MFSLVFFEPRNNHFTKGFSRRLYEIPTESPLSRASSRPHVGHEKSRSVPLRQLRFFLNNKPRTVVMLSFLTLTLPYLRRVYFAASKRIDELDVRRRQLCESELIKAICAHVDPIICKRRSSWDRAVDGTSSADWGRPPRLTTTVVHKWRYYVARRWIRTASRRWMDEWIPTPSDWKTSSDCFSMDFPLPQPVPHIFWRLN